MSVFNSLQNVVNKVKLGVVGSESSHVLKACEYAYKNNFVELIFIGDKEKTDKIIKDYSIDFEYSFYEASSPQECAQKAVALAKEGVIELLIKGSVDTAAVMRALFDKEKGFSSKGLCSAVSVFEYNDRFLLVTDAAINIYPDLNKKAEIIKNALLVANALGIKQAKVASLSPTEFVQEKIIESVHGAELAKMAKEGFFGDAYVEMMALDVALDADAAKYKNIENEVAGKADILLAHDLNSANMLHKSFSLLSDKDHGAVVVGTGVPLIITSRSEDDRTKYNSILLASALTAFQNKKGD